MAVKARTGFSLKDQLFNEGTVNVLADAIGNAWPGFDRIAYVQDALAGFETRELKARIEWLVTLLDGRLPRPLEAALDVLRQALPAPLDPTLADDDFGHFIWAVPAEYAARHGCERRHLSRALPFLRECTLRFSAENAIRPFLIAHRARTMAFVRRLARDDNYHARRLASEGTRPLLPWAPRVILPLDEVMPVLDTLHADATRYVTRSVANHLNDWSKLEPAAVLDTLRRWNAAGRQAPDELAWMTRHALRTLRKAADPAALELLGYPASPAVSLKTLERSARVRVGEAFEWRFELRSRAAQRLAVQLRIHFLKANGRHAVKVFKVRDASFGRGETVALTARQSMRPMTTRTLYPGAHHVDIEANGKVLAESTFELIA